LGKGLEKVWPSIGRLSLKGYGGGLPGKAEKKRGRDITGGHSIEAKGKETQLDDVLIEKNRLMEGKGCTVLPRGGKEKGALKKKSPLCNNRKNGKAVVAGRRRVRGVTSSRKRLKGGRYVRKYLLLNAAEGGRTRNSECSKEAGKKGAMNRKKGLEENLWIYRKVWRDSW